MGFGDLETQDEADARAARLGGPRIDRHPAQKGDMRDTYADTTAARRALGYAPAVPIASGIEDEYKWLCNAVTVE